MQKTISQKKNNLKYRVISSTSYTTSEKNHSKYRGTLEPVKMIYDLSLNLGFAFKTRFNLIVNCSKILFNGKLVGDIYFCAECSC